MKTFFVIVIFTCLFLLVYINSSSKIEQKYILPTIPKIERNGSSDKVFTKPMRSSLDLLSQEEKEKYDYYFLSELYPAVMGKDIGAEEIRTWQNVLAQGASREGVYRALVLNDNYFELEEKKNKVELGLADWVHSFLIMYAGVDYSTDKIQEFGFYTVKRILIERILEVSDEFEEEDLFIWYGLLSQKLAEDFTDAFKLKIRKDTDVDHHILWAKSVPEQYLKSELIIKLSLVCEYLRNR